MQHQMGLQTHPFEQIKAGIKTIELRLNDDKRQGILVGDTVVFLKEPDRTETITATVIERLVYPTFAELFSNLSAASMGFGDNSLLTRPTYYTEEQELRYGALGLKIQIEDVHHEA